MKTKYVYIVIGVLALGLIGWMTQSKETATLETSKAIQPRIVKPIIAAPVQAPARVAIKAPTPKTTTPKIGKRVEYTPPALPDLDALKLQQTETGGYMLFPVDSGESQGHMEIQKDLRDPLTTVGACTRWIVGCVEPGQRSLDDCALSVPQCTTDKPWEEEAHCCPASCFDSYATLRESGVEPITAFDTVYFADGSCFPGLEDLLTGVSPAPPAHY
ncbi:MAG: hypothetical protein HOI23_02080 [Deltaproteobacteria bacterium]|jgi:hypothetical protein|nr:hypothetical protein [Deltaproteobacteria bacterium]MBT6434502.1 hypothetical protein [Deltaproteobacteria bacterium]MBT6490271.1 hypothetical protein [Deltaproteobacteria bacterium]